MSFEEIKAELKSFLENIKVIDQRMPAFSQSKVDAIHREKRKVMVSLEKAKHLAREVRGLEILREFHFLERKVMIEFIRTECERSTWLANEANNLNKRLHSSHFSSSCQGEPIERLLRRNQPYSHLTVVDTGVTPF